MLRLVSCVLWYVWVITFQNMDQFLLHLLDRNHEVICLQEMYLWNKIFKENSKSTWHWSSDVTDCAVIEVNKIVSTRLKDLESTLVNLKWLTAWSNLALQATLLILLHLSFLNNWICNAYICWQCLWYSAVLCLCLLLHCVIRRLVRKCCRTFYSIWTDVGNNIAKYKSFPRLIGGDVKLLCNSLRKLWQTL